MTEVSISNLVANHFPAFYQEEGPNLIAFIQAYYEYLEQSGNAIHEARSLLSYRDIDTTLDKFILFFKEKYLKNIQFDIATNKQLLIKNSLDLYRAKGTPRAASLFFKLIYGLDSSVYFPANDIFKLSDGDWYKPQYLEVTATERNIDYVGKQITGIKSGATAFVEKYIKRRMNRGFVHILYVSNISGTFINNEVLKSDTIYNDSPKVLGSVNQAIVENSGQNFNIGDIVSIDSFKGKGALGRVSSTKNTTGIVDFTLEDGGYGYTTNAHCLVSEKVIELSNVVSSNSQYFKLFDQVKQPLSNLKFTSASGLIYAGDSLTSYSNNVPVATAIVLSSDQTNSISNSELFLSVTSGAFSNTRLIYTSGNAVSANVLSVTDKTVNGQIMGISSNGILNIGNISGKFSVGDTISQSNSTTIIANAIVVGTNTSFSNGFISVANIHGVFNKSLPLAGTNGTANIFLFSTTLGLYNITGSFVSNPNAYLYAVSTNTSMYPVSISTGTGANFVISSISEIEQLFLNTDLLGSNNVSWVNSSIIAQANQTYMSLPIHNYAYGFPKNPQGNSQSILYSCLNYQLFNIGTIAAISQSDPGQNYNRNPFVLVVQDYISGFNKQDYFIDVANVSNSFKIGEKIQQVYPGVPTLNISVPDYSGFIVGEKIYQGNSSLQVANGEVYAVIANTNTLQLINVNGNFSANALIHSVIHSGVAQTAISVSNGAFLVTIAKGIIKDFSITGSNAILNVKRLSFATQFSAGGNVIGLSSGATGNILHLSPDTESKPIGLNANVIANTSTSNGSITGIQIIDSGFGYSNSEVLPFVSENNQNAGTAKIVISGSGTGSGYYRSNDGFLSTNKYLRDGNYYQEYSYEIVSALPFEKYAEIFKKVMHIAGTQLFGSILIEDEESVKVSLNESVIVSNSDVIFIYNGPYLDFENLNNSMYLDTVIFTKTPSPNTEIVNTTLDFAQSNNSMYIELL